MACLIRLGGAVIILTVFALFAFIGHQTLPLFKSASVQSLSNWKGPPFTPLALGMDEWGTLPYFISSDSVAFISLSDRSIASTRALTDPSTPFIAATTDAESQRTFLLKEDGSLHLFQPNYQKDPTGNIQSAGTLTALPLPPFPQAHFLAVAKTAESEVFALLRGTSTPLLTIIRYGQRENLMGEVVSEVSEPYHLSIPAEPVFMGLNQRGERLLTLNQAGLLRVYAWENKAWSLRQHLAIFPPQSQVATCGWVQGNESLVVFNQAGQGFLVSPTFDTHTQTHTYRVTEKLPDCPRVSVYAKSTRNRVFLSASAQSLYLTDSTTATTRAEIPLNFTPAWAFLDARYQHALLGDAAGRLHLYGIDDPHPQGGWKAFFAPIWYEGKSKAQYQWQSTGASEAFQPKLSMMPLILGSLKGTFYAMLFSTPIALLAALYVSRFMHKNHKRWVKPAMEMMASLPSVILGFIAAFWLAPLLEAHVVSVLILLLLLPLSVFLFSFLYAALPVAWRCRFPLEGKEHLCLLPLLVLTACAAYPMGPYFESLFFTVIVDGQSQTSFSLFWTQKLGLAFDQRNALVVGFAMGFAVIPIIFTIAEDAISNVPESLTSASLALGASPWQTAARVVLPAAGSGMFSAFIIGLGRAVGETMIVLMASGNTPLMNLNPFDGMRTFATNIAVELPEAPLESTLYRTLFFGALLLFAFTFVLNTIAEITRMNLRKRYRAID